MPSNPVICRKKTKSAFEILCLKGRTLVSIDPVAAVLLLRTTYCYLINPKWPKSEILTKAFYRASVRYLNVWHALFTAMRHANLERFPPTSTGLHAFLQCKVSKPKTRTCTALDVFVSLILVFQFYAWENHKMLAAQALSHQRNNISRIKDVFFKLPANFLARFVPDTSAKLWKKYFPQWRHPPGFSCNAPRRAQTRNVHALLQAMHVHLFHRAHFFLPREDLLHIRDPACISASHSALQDAGVTAGMSSKASWKLVSEKTGQAWRDAYFQSYAAHMSRDWFTILEDFASYEVPAPLVEFLSSSSAPSQPFTGLYSTIGQTFTVSDTSSWSLNGNTDVQGVDSGDAGKVHTRFTSTKRRFTPALEQDPGREWMTKRPACTHVRAHWLAKLLELDKNGANTSAIPVTGGRYLYTSDSWKPQVAENDLAAWKGSSAGFFFMFNGADIRNPYVCKGSYRFVFYQGAVKHKLGHILKMDAVTLPPFSVLTSSEYVQHDRMRYLRYWSLRYPVYLFPCDRPPHDSIIYEYD